MTVRLWFAIFSSLTVGAWAVLSPGLARAQDYDAGMAAYEAGDYERAVRIWDPLALSGDATAQYSLGKLFETGNIDLERDYGRAVEWYRLAAAQGTAAAQNNLGLMYAQGRGVARDAGQAVELWRGASKQNHAMAQFNLGLAYFRGEGVAENKQEAESWFRRAAELGLADAQYALGQVRLHGLTAAADKGEALAWYQLAAAQGHLKARRQAEILREEGVKPRIEVSLDAPKDPIPAVPAATQTALASAPAPAELMAREAVKDSAIEQTQTEAAPATMPTAAKLSPATTQPAVKQGIATTQIAPPTAAQTKAAPLAEPAKPAQTAAPKQPARMTAPAEAVPAPQIKSQVARAGVGAVPGGASGKLKAWLFSAKSEGEAIRYLRRLEGEQGPLLAGIDSAVIPVRLSDGEVFYRVVAGNFETWIAGREWCNSLNIGTPGTFCKILPRSRAAR